MDIFQSLAHSDNVVVALLASIVMGLSGVVIYQWKYTMRETVPKWIWDSLIGKVDSVLEIQRGMSIILDERLKK